MNNGQPVTKGSIATRMGMGIVFLALIAAGLSYGFLSSDDKQIRAIGYKTIELEIQVFFVGIVGGIIIQEYNRGQARRTAFNESRKAALRRLVDAYSRTKKNKKKSTRALQTL